MSLTAIQNVMCQGNGIEVYSVWKYLLMYDWGFGGSRYMSSGVCNNNMSCPVDRDSKFLQNVGA